MSGSFSPVNYTILLILICITSWVSSKNTSTSVIYKQFANLEAHTKLHETTPVLLFLIDSLRWDILHQYRLRTRQDLPGFAQLKKLGGHVERVAPVFPAECYPNLLSILTGQYPENHHLLFTTMYDEVTNRSFNFDGRSSNRLKSDWIAANELWNPGFQGKKTSFFHIPLCSREEVAELYCEPYAKQYMQPDALNQTLLRALERLSDRTAEVAVVYYDPLDEIGHTEGPLSDELLLRALPELDRVVYGLVQHLRLSHPDVHLVLTSDHGMTSVHHNVLLDRFISPNLVKKVINRGSTVGIWPRSGYYDQAYRRLNDIRVKNFTVYNRSAIPASWHTGGPLFPPILLVAEPGSLIHSNYWPIQSNAYSFPYKGAHGYDATASDMHVPLFILGPHVRPNVTYRGDSLDHLDTHQLLAALSGRVNDPEFAVHSLSVATLWYSHGLITGYVIVIAVLCVILCLLLLLLGLWKLFRPRLQISSPGSAAKCNHADDFGEHLIQADETMNDPGCYDVTA